MAMMRYQVYRNEDVAPLPSSMVHLEHLGLRRFCKLIWVLSAVVHRNRGGKGAPKARSHYRIHLGEVSRILADWPRGFNAFLADNYGDTLDRVKELPSFHKYFSWLTVRLVKNDGGDDNAYEFLEREVYSFGANYWHRSGMARDERSSKLMPEKVRWGTMTEAAEEFGFHMLTLGKRIASGEIRSKRVRADSSRSHLVDMEFLRKQRFTQYPAVSARDAAPMVGVSIETLKALRASGVFKEQVRPAFPGSFTKEDVDAFARRIQALAIGKCSIRGEGVMALDEAFTEWTASPAEKAGFISHMLGHPETVVGKRRGKGVGRLQVLEKALSDYFRTIRGDQEECMPVLDAAKRLGCTAAVVTSLRRDGHLEVVQRHGRELTSLASVQKFDAKYVSISKVAKAVGLYARTAYAAGWTWTASNTFELRPPSTQPHLFVVPTLSRSRGRCVRGPIRSDEDCWSHRRSRDVAILLEVSNWQHSILAGTFLSERLSVPVARCAACGMPRSVLDQGGRVRSPR
ncbi:MAG: hypothetical protein R3F22_11675 [Lysobacteraceae bacterium]